MEVIAIAIQKGGTGKTSTAAALAQAAAHRKRKCLAIDLDPQGNLSFALAANTNGAGSYELLQGAPAADLLQRTDYGLHIIPASVSLSTITSGKGSARRLQGAIRPLKEKYDLIIIDTPPTAGELQYNALQAATGLIIPLQADAYNINSLYQMHDTARQFQKSNPELKIKGFILTMYDQRSNIAKQMREAITSNAAALDIPFLGAVRPGVAIREAAALQESLFIYAPKSKPAQDYLNIFDNLEG